MAKKFESTYSRQAISELTPAAWPTFDVDAFILANVGVGGRMLVRPFMRRFAHFDLQEVCNEIFVRAKPRVASVLRRKSELGGPDMANQLFAALFWAVRQARTDFFKAYPNEERPFGDFEREDEKESEWTIGERLSFAAAESGVDDEPSEERDNVLSSRIEEIRPHLTLREYQIFRMRVRDGMCPSLIAKTLKTTPSYVNLALRCARSRLTEAFSLRSTDTAANYAP